MEDINAEPLRHTIKNWIEKYSEIFFNYTYKRVADKAAVKDIIQETFIAAWKNNETFKKKANERTWLFAILKNKLVDHYRTQARIAKLVSHTDYFFDNVDHWTQKAAPKYWEPQDESLNNKEFYSVLNNCKFKLSSMQQLAFTMKYLDEYETDYICKVLKITASNYWVLIHRSKLQLRQCLEKNWFGKT